MKQISKFAKPMGIAMAVIGIAMIAVSAYYLYAYMRSGSDAEEFNVDAAAPEDMLTLLGQGLPEPKFDDPVIPSTSQTSDRSETQNGQMETETVLSDTEAVIEVDVDGFETVSIASKLPGAGLALEPIDVSVAEPKTDTTETILEDQHQPVVHSVRNAGDNDALSEDLAPTLSSPTYSTLAAKQTVAGDAISPSIPTDVMLDTFTAIYPGGNMNPRYWSQPYWAGNLPFGGPTIPEGFVPVDASDMAYAQTSGEPALRMRIPSIGLDATVSELEIRDFGDSREWSTPDKVVGHIPTTAKPGELANGWYFGHLDNFLSNEGDIFRRLPEISAMIKDDPVDIFLTTEDAEYMYRVTSTRQLHRDELYLEQSDNAQISLVTCWPFKVYDHRIVVSAVLIAVKPLTEV